MTQHKWSTTDGWDILAGWDRMSQHFFIDISQECLDCKGEGFTNDDEECTKCDGQGDVYLFNNLDDETGLANNVGGMTLPQVQLALTRYLTEWPSTFLDNIKQDQHLDVGNQTYRYPAVGLVKKLT